jgi:hypothetical protein
MMVNFDGLSIDFYVRAKRSSFGLTVKRKGLQTPAIER